MRTRVLISAQDKGQIGPHPEARTGAPERMGTLQSHFDLEVYSASRRRDLLVESERLQRLALLDVCDGQGSSGQRTGLADLRSMIASVVARMRPEPVAAAMPEIVPFEPPAATISVLPMQPRKPAAAADPYAGFIVIARASSVPMVAEPDRIHDLAS